MRDVDEVIAKVSAAFPDVEWKQIEVLHPGADDDGLWFFWLRSKEGVVQIESSKGQCPFIVETNKHEKQVDGNSVTEVADTVVERLRL